MKSKEITSPCERVTNNHTLEFEWRCHNNAVSLFQRVCKNVAEELELKSRYRHLNTKNDIFKGDSANIILSPVASGNFGDLVYVRIPEFRISRRTSSLRKCYRRTRHSE